MATQEHDVYKLRCSLIGHSMDVRALVVSPNGDIVTTSRDKTAKLWTEDPKLGLNYQEKLTYKGHTGYVTSVCLIPGNEESPEGYTVTGSKDSTILVFPRNLPDPLHKLKGHSDTVSYLTWKSDMLISGSWDHSIRVWKKWDCVMHLKGHSGPVWSLAVIEIPNMDKSILSASADKTLKCWRDGKEVQTYRGHTDCVRGVAVIDSEKFLSCSNDASVRFWSVSGECLATYYGHTSFIYSISNLENLSGFVTGGEDRSIRVWDLCGNNMNTIYLPAQSVWCVAVLPNSDIVAGSSDGICRVFTQNVDRQADASELSQFEESLAKFKVAVEDVGGIKKSELPDKSFLHTPGKRDGQTIMVRDDSGKVLCYNWSSSKNQWEAVGEVVGGAGGSANTSGRVLYEGREYDYVFDVDLDEGRTLKLPYNKGEDPWMVAQTFIHRHQLPQDHLDQVANFITKNANVSLPPAGSNEYYDPFTGGSRYIPSGGAGGSFASNDVDPFTGGGRYVPSYSQRNTTATNTTPKVNSQYFPQVNHLKFESVNKTGILSKLEESNKEVADPLTQDEVVRLVEAVAGSDVTVSELGPLEKALQWPPERVWPVLDILRLALRSNEAQERWLGGGKGESIVSLLVSFLNNHIPMPTQLLALRCLTNMSCQSPGQKALGSLRNSVISSVISLAPYPNKNMEIAASTLFINYSILLTKNEDLDSQCQLLSAVATLTLHVKDPEAKFRTLVALGTLLCCGSEPRSFATSLDLKSVIEKFKSSTDLAKVAECAEHILMLL